MEHPASQRLCIQRSMVEVNASTSHINASLICMFTGQTILVSCTSVSGPTAQPQSQMWPGLSSLVHSHYIDTAVLVRTRTRIYIQLNNRSIYYIYSLALLCSVRLCGCLSRCPTAVCQSYLWLLVCFYINGLYLWGLCLFCNWDAKWVLMFLLAEAPYKRNSEISVKIVNVELLNNVCIILKKELILPIHYITIENYIYDKNRLRTVS